MTRDSEPRSLFSFSRQTPPARQQWRTGRGSARAWANAALLVGLLFASPSFAQDQAAAEALFRSAQRAAKMGDWVTACDRFEESNRLDPAPGTVLNLGRCKEKLGKLAGAWKSYVKAAQLLSDDDRRAIYARQKAEELEPRVPKVTLRAPEEDVPYRVVVSGIEFSRATLDVPLPFDPGVLEIIVQAEGYEEEVIRVQLNEGADVTCQLTLGDELESVGAAVPQDKPQRGNGAAVASLVIGSVGVAAGIVGGVWAAVELPKVKSHCEDDRCDASGHEAAKRGRVASVIGLSGAGVAVVGYSLAAVLWKKNHKESAVAVSPVPGGGVLSFRTEL